MGTGEPAAASTVDPAASPVRVAFVTGHAVFGGAEGVMLTLLERLGPEWVAGTVALEEGSFPERLRAAGVPVEVVPARGRLDIPRAAWRLRPVIGRLDPEVVLANGVKAAVLCAAALPASGLPLVWHKHDTTLDGPMANILARRCDRVIGVSETVLRAFPSALRARTVAIHNGLPDRHVDREAARRRIERLTGGGPVVALSGRLAIGKGQLDLVEAAPAILDAHPAAHFALLGGDDAAFPGHRQMVQARAGELGVSDRIHSIGHREDAVELVAGCEVLVAPSKLDPGGWREGFGLAVAEAMQVGTPVVAYASGSLPEVIADAGVLVPEGDVAALARAVVDVLGDPARRAALAERGRARAASFRIGVTIERIGAVLREVADATPSSKPSAGRYR